MAHLMSTLIQNHWFLGTLCFLMIMLPILGIMIVHGSGSDSEG